MDGLPIQPLAGALAATSHAQVAQSAHRAAEIRRTQNRVKVSSLDQDTLERQVESAEAIDGVHDKPDEQSSGQPKRERKQAPTPEDQDPPHIDLRA